MAAANAAAPEKKANAAPRPETEPYASANATWDSVAASIPTAAPAANDTPWSVARKNATGPDVIGRATSHPPTWWPKRRPDRLAPPINTGVTTAFTATFCPGTTYTVAHRNRELDRDLPAERRSSGRTTGRWSRRNHLSVASHLEF